MVDNRTGWTGWNRNSFDPRKSDMSTLQVYETTVTDAGRNWTARFAVFPQRSFYGEIPTSEDALRSLLSLTAFEQVHTASALPQVLALLLDRDELDASPQHGHGESAIPESSEVDSELFAFAEELSFTEVVPFESSPLSPKSLASVVLQASKAGAAPLGAMVAYAAVGSTPLLLVAVPTAIVLCGGAVAFGKWLDQHRDELFANILGATSKQRRKPMRRIKLNRTKHGD